jgi:hypothetical protein
VLWFPTSLIAAKALSHKRKEMMQFDRAGLLGLLKDLHGASRDNQAFLHARLGLGADPLERWIAPDVMTSQAWGAHCDRQQFSARDAAPLMLRYYVPNRLTSFIAAGTFFNVGKRMFVAHGMSWARCHAGTS